MYTNARSIVNKIQELKLLAADCSPDVIAITESWTHDAISNQYLSIPNYTLVARHDRNDTQNGRGGGLLIYVNEKLQSTETSCPSDFNQYCSVQINSTQGSPIHIYLVYRSPNSNAENNEKLIEVMKEATNNAIVIGDFNYPHANWEMLSGCTESQILIDTSLDMFWMQYVDFPTHHNGNTLDLVFAEEGMINEVRDDGPLATSDHSVLMIETNHLLSTATNKMPHFNYKKGDFQKLCKMFSEVRWHDELQGQGVNASWLRFREIYSEVVGKYIPLANGKWKKRPPWMTPELLKMLQKKRRLWKKYKNSQTAEALNEYKNLRKKLKKQILRSKLKFEKEIARNSKQNPKVFYAYIGGKKTNRTGVGPLQDAQGEIVTDDKVQAQMLNEYYGSVFEVEQPEIPDVGQLSSSTLTSVVVTERIVKEKLKNLKRYSSPGPDGIQNIVLIEAWKELALPLTIIFKKSLRTSEVPEDWRTANVTPVHKGGNKKLVNNYRPISLTSTVCKILESIIKTTLMSHLISNNLILSSQHGFMEKKSCLTNLLHCMEEVTKVLDDGDCADVLYLDFAKAFDKVQHQRLVAKLKALGIDGELLAWIKAWLSGRNQRVVLNGQQSDLIQVLCSVPQGSVLGPILFIIFINDIDVCIESVLALLLKFADDTKVIKRIQSQADNEDLQTVIDNLYEWAKKWQMYFNVDKCKLVHVGRSNPKFQYVMNGIQIKAVESERDLGIMFDHTAKPSLQCAKAASKANQVLGQLLRSFQCREKDVLVQLYKVFVRPHLEYAIQAWSPYLVKDIEILEKVQKRLVRQIRNVTGTYEEKLAKIGLTTLQERRSRGDCIEAFKMLKGFSRVDHTIWFDMVSRTTGPQTRLSTDPLALDTQPARLDLRKNFFSVRTPPIWNSLPLTLRQSKSVNQFKNEYDQLKQNKTA